MSATTKFTAAQADALKAKIQAEIAAQASPPVGIKLASDVWADFISRGWIEERKFGVAGTNLLAFNVPAMDDSYAEEDMTLADGTYKVGKRS